MASCRANDAPPIAAIPPGDSLLVETDGGLALVETPSGRVLATARPAAAAWDGSALAGSTADGLNVLDSRGRVAYAVPDAGGLGPRVVSPGGERVALATGAASPYRPQGRTETTISIVGRGGELERLTLPGCVEPEAFGLQGNLLYVLDYLPPTAPDRYRVRMVDLTTKQYSPLLTRDKALIPPGSEEEMRGEGRQGVYDEAHALLFTLYTHQPGHEHTRDLLRGARADAPDVHAFVHTLSLDGQFAYCIDLPAPFGEAPASAHAIAIARLSGVPFVVDIAHATVAEIDPQELTVRRVVAAAFPASDGPATVAVSPDGSRVFVGAGSQIHVLDRTTLAAVASWTPGGEVRGIVPGPQAVWVGSPGSIAALDPASGAVRTRSAVPGLTSLLRSV